MLRSTPADHTLAGVLTRLRLGVKPREDRELLQKLDRAFGKHLPALQRYVRNEVPGASPQQVEELVQDVLETAWTKLDTYEAVEAFRAFLFALARNRCANARRKRSDVLTEDGLVEAGSEDLGTLARLADAERDALVEEASQNVLEPREQELIVLRWVMDYPLGEVAARLELPSANAARVGLQRCKRRMQVEVRRLLAARGLGESFLG